MHRKEISLANERADDNEELVARLSAIIRERVVGADVLRQEPIRPDTSRTTVV